MVQVMPINVSCIYKMLKTLKKALREYKQYYKLPNKQSCIKIVYCLIKLGRVCQKMHQFTRAERYFLEAGQTMKSLNCRSNAEYFEIQMHRAQLYRLTPTYPKESIREMIGVIESSITSLTDFEGDYCETLHDFYKELQKLYKSMNYPLEPRMELRQKLSKWKLKFEAQNFTSLTCGLSLIAASMASIKDSINAMNLVSCDTFGLARLPNRVRYQMI